MKDCPAYFGEHGKVGARQPNLGLDELFGRAGDLRGVHAGLARKSETAIQGKHDWRAVLHAAVRTEAGGEGRRTVRRRRSRPWNTASGKGRTLLIGTFPGAVVLPAPFAARTKAFFASLLDWAGIPQQVKVSSADVKGRLHTGTGGNYLWVVNPNREPRTVTVTLDKRAGAFSRGRDVSQGDAKVSVNGSNVQLTVADRDAAVVLLEP